MKKQILFKIVSIKKANPIYFVKTQQTPVQLNPHQKQQSNLLRMQESKKGRQFTKSRINSSFKAIRPFKKDNYMENRSNSCDFIENKHNEESKQSKKKLQKTIREYLKIAYKRIQHEKGTYNIRFPDIKITKNKVNIENEAKYMVEPQFKHQKMGNNFCLSKNRIKKKMLTKRQSIKKPVLVNPEIISAWDHSEVYEEF